MNAAKHLHHHATPNAERESRIRPRQFPRVRHASTPRAAARLFRVYVGGAGTILQRSNPTMPRCTHTTDATHTHTTQTIKRHTPTRQLPSSVSELPRCTRAANCCLMLTIIRRLRSVLRQRMSAPRADCKRPLRLSPDGRMQRVASCVGNDRATRAAASCSAVDCTTIQPQSTTAGD